MGLAVPVSRRLGIALAVIALLALALRVPDLPRRPMHNDEAVNAVKLQGLWEHGQYRYDPHEYHGPVLYYATLPVLWLSGAKDFAHVTETDLRLVPVVFGVGLILVLGLMGDGLGRSGTVFAALLTALSPAMVFYSRYYIHEMLLVFFTLLLLAAGWRYYQTRRLGWAVLAGAATGLMYATKETFVLTLGAGAGAAALNCLWNTRSRRAPPGSWKWSHLVVAALTAAALAALFFSSFLSNPGGLVDAVRTYLAYLHRAGGASVHDHPWYFYLERLTWFHQGRGPVWTEGTILVLAAIAFVAALRRTPPASLPAHPGLVRFLGFCTVLLTVIYSLISYKTPWCALSFWLGAILLAGVGMAVLLRWQTRRWLQGLVGAGLVCVAAHLLWQSWQTSYLMPADRRNPYAYSQTSPDLLDLVDKVEALARVYPQGQEMLIKVIVPEDQYWPLPWYLRAFKQVGWYNQLPAGPAAPVMIVGASLQESLDTKTEATHTMVGIYSLRPREFLGLYVAQDLWRKFMANKTGTVHP